MGKKAPQINYGPTFALHGYRNLRWIENVSRGLRFVGFADKIVNLRHTGWFSHDDGDGGENYRGVVYQLPARSGAPQFLYGYADPNNDDCALVSHDIETDKVRTHWCNPVLDAEGWRQEFRDALDLRINAKAGLRADGAIRRNIARCRCRACLHDHAHLSMVHDGRTVRCPRCPAPCREYGRKWESEWQASARRDSRAARGRCIVRAFETEDARARLAHLIWRDA